ncbi:DEHA2A12342p [Debaryomyces hansenii CBS767]|uniref:DEHA2A12342p n=1 Tax=Debaryomyces hansenii (strain ATCC 36239 / CBS 767 / BCRC 21394 / JCM 1990 / NBRC 0083 / IGC 2968) TaxID=284592 RepID=Q6BY52_DEBHA|nr:DEHA2A12342p [Debaryomyces hansenii CBS767]CAG84842.1 DEHA2A12342p [Debaryomyces hansenii CBS767]|eukprot:XP_456867.1 DEHA2A12342p [Debaryomyces hansenii CBS767]
MSDKHFLPSDTGKLVPNCLRAITYEYEFLSLLDKEKVIYNNEFDRSKVALISGGGSGHEPGFYGLVGSGMLSAAAQGDIFASPNYKNVKAAEKVCHELGDSGEWAGCIFIITNYTGDNLYFGMAAQDLIARYGNEKIRILRVTDDVAIKKSSNSLVGRRTLAGITIVSKLAGAASQNGHNKDEVFEFGQKVIASTASVNAGLDHVHIPGHRMDVEFGKLGKTQLEIGLGIHNEPGAQKLDYIPSNEELVFTLLDMILNKEDEGRGFFNYSNGDKFVLLINNLGGIPIIEEKNILHTTLETLKEKYDIIPARIYTGTFFTSFNAQIFTITLFNATTAATKTFTTDKIFELLDERTNATCWPNTIFTGNESIQNDRIIRDFVGYDDDAPNTVKERSQDLRIDPEKLEKIIRTAAERVIKKEPELTDWDTKMGDGDCGYGLRTGAEKVLHKLEVDKIASSGSILKVLHVVLNVLKDDMGGTLGAIIFIFMKSVINEVEEFLRENSNLTINQLFAFALPVGLETLYTYTKARQGHRTVMDVLIPFVHSFSETQDINKAVRVAYNAAEGTRSLKPKLGRATYVGGLADKTIFPPDPGAYGIYEIISALTL